MTHDYYTNLPRRRIGAGALFTDAEGRSLLVEPVYKPTWEIPGGVVEAGEDPRSCVRREVSEELGLVFDPGRLLVIEHKTESPPHGDSMMLIYDGGQLEKLDETQLQMSELRSYRLIPENQLETYVGDRLAFRSKQALAAHRDGETIEIVDGRVV